MVNQDLIIDGKGKCNKLLLNNGYLQYKNAIKYLGVIISDTGNIKKDVQMYIQKKPANVYTKFTKFCAKNYFCPLKIKLKVLDTCMSSSILYGCETWSDAMPTEVEVIYRIGIKTALSIRDNTNNEIVYIESGLYPIECIVKKRQLSFWMHILKSSESNYLRSMLQKTSAYDIYYIKYYKKLEST